LRILSPRPAIKKDLVAVIDASRDESRGRTFLMPPSGEKLEGATNGISHECLLRRLDRLKKWLDYEDKEAEMFLELAWWADIYRLEALCAPMRRVLKCCFQFSKGSVMYPLTGAHHKGYSARSIGVICRSSSRTEP
jgi:hypothetical protein